jgi:hypothetical protein
MRIALLSIALVLAAQNAFAQANPGGDLDPAHDDLTKKRTFNRDDILVATSIIDGVTGAWAAYALATGTHSGLCDAVTILSTGPAVLFGAAVLSEDANDPGGEHVRTFSKNFMILPRVEPLPNERSTRVGLALAGTF